jgi:ABC-type nitrate/sulfonate/bicarbonate transport system permease component
MWVTHFHAFPCYTGQSMAVGKRWRNTVYTSSLHVFLTLLTLALPFAFLAVFSRATHMETSRLLGDLGISSLRLLAAYLIALVLSWILAVLFSRGKTAAVSLPLFDVMQSFPTFAALPLATYLWGASGTTVIVFLVLTVMWPILFSIISSLHLIRKDWEEAVQISGLKGWAYVRYFLIPVTVPGIVTGSIVGLGEGWEALVATEIIAQVKSGLGGFFEEFSHNPTVTAFGIFGFLLFIFAVNRVLWIPLLNWSHRSLEE